MLGDQGTYADGELLKTELGSDLFLALTEANPTVALECLKMTIGRWTKSELLEFDTGRRAVVHSLERIAVWKALFTGAAELLLLLAEAENETWSNNATGVFTQLFSAGRGPVAPTEASPEERFSVIEHALLSDSKERRKLGLMACNVALSTGPFHRAVGAEFQGLRRTPELWMPKTWGELFNAYHRVWRFLWERLDHLPKDEQPEAIKILLQRVRGLTGIQNIADMVIDSMYELASKPYVNQKEVLATAVGIIHYDGKRLPPEVRIRWENLRDELTGTGYSSLLKRYVGTDLLVDRFDNQGNQVDQKQAEFEKLAQQSIENLALLKPELQWLVTSEAADGYRFGYQLGIRDENFTLPAMLMDAQRGADQNRSLFFLGGYFRSLVERDPNRWETELDLLSKLKPR